MMMVRCCLKYSAIHGIGCFAEVDIKKGDVVWKFDPIIDLVFPEDEMGKFPDAFVAFLKMHSYGQMDGKRKTVILCGDLARHMNHHDEANVIEDDTSYVNYAGRDIKAGEELTCNYNDFDVDADYKLRS